MSLSTFTRSVQIARSPADVFAWHERAGAFERLAPPWQKIEVLARQGGIRDGATVSLRTKIGPSWVRWEVGHRDYVEEVQFRDVQTQGPFASWEHLHHLEPAAGGTATVLTDRIAYRLPFGRLGKLAGGWFARRELDRLFAYRHAVTRADLEGTGRYRGVRPLRFLVAGASGLVGRSLVPFLQTQGHTVVRLVRREAAGADEVSWDPARGRLDSGALREIDVVVNLAGEGIADARWSPARREAILRSRVDSTRTLVQALGRLTRGGPFTFISGSASGVYGSRGDEELTEDAAAGGGFLAGVCTAWEQEALAAESLGLRVVRLRTGLVLTPAGGALAKLLPVFRLGGGGRLGSGRQWMSWISIDDLVGAIYHAVIDLRCTGALNAVAPGPVTNAEFTRVLARVLGRPAWLPVPAPALKAVFGELAEETLLAGARVRPAKLEAAGYVFRHENLQAALRHLLGASSGRARAGGRRG